MTRPEILPSNPGLRIQASEHATLAAQFFQQWHRLPPVAIRLVQTLDVVVHCGATDIRAGARRRLANAARP